MDKPQITFCIDDRKISAPASSSIIEAVWHAGYPMVERVGCLGQGVCGSCRVMVRRAGEKQVVMSLACETIIEEGMDVSYVPTMAQRDHPYQIGDFTDSWKLMHYVHDTFPEAVHCRHCGGCNSACPRGIEVEKGVNLIAAGHLAAAIPLFETCIMCDFCTMACPEDIAPNHLGLFARRLGAALAFRPANLLSRLDQMARSELTITDPELTTTAEEHHA